jgi:hypothetical protein
MTDLPPLDQPQAYVVVGPNDQRGPYTLELLIGEVLAGRLHDATPVWWPGLAEWTTMGGHPGVAAELARRRAGYAAPEAPAPAPAEPYPTGQYQQTAGWDTAAPGQPTEPVSGQYYSPDMYAGESVAANPSIDPTPAAEPVAPVEAVDQPVQAGEDAPSEAVGETQLVGETVPAEVTGGESADVFTTAAAGGPIVAEPEPAPEPEVVAPDQVHSPSPTLDPAHQGAFESLVERSRARTRGADQVAAADAALVDAVVAAVESQGFRCVDRSTGDDTHELRFEGGPDEQVTVRLGRLTGDDPEAVRAGDVHFEVRYRSSSYGGGVDAGPGANGEVVVVADEWSGQATSAVWLRLPLEDYLLGDLSVDSVAVSRDVGATVAVVRARMG